MGSPLRILHVVVNMNRGGAETLLMNLYRNIDRTIIQFDFLTCKEGVFDREIIQMGGKIHRIPYISNVGHFEYIKQLNQFFFQHNGYNVVHSHMDKMSGLILRAAKAAGIPVRISHSHNTNSEGGIVAKLYKWYAGNFIIPNATELIACSRQAAEWLFKEKSASTRIIKNGIEYKKFAFSPYVREKVRSELNIHKDVFVFGHVGRFVRQKNHSFLLNMFAEFSKVNQQSQLILIGDGPLRSNLERQVKELKLEDKVRFLGVRSHIHRFLQAFDVLVFPSLHEGLPVSLIEAQGSGLPCLVSNNISNEVDIGLNLIDFLSLENKKSWIKKLNELVRSPKKRLINSSIIAKQGYDIKETACKLQKYYLNITG